MNKCTEETNHNDCLRNEYCAKSSDDSMLCQPLNECPIMNDSITGICPSLKPCATNQDCDDSEFCSKFQLKNEKGSCLDKKYYDCENPERDDLSPKEHC